MAGPMFAGFAFAARLVVQAISRNKWRPAIFPPNRVARPSSRIDPTRDRLIPANTSPDSACYHPRAETNTQRTLDGIHVTEVAVDIAAPRQVVDCSSFHRPMVGPPLFGGFGRGETIPCCSSH